MQVKGAFLAGFAPRRGLAGWVAVKGGKLFRQNQFVAGGEPQPILVAVVVDHDFATAGQKLPA